MNYGYTDFFKDTPAEKVSFAHSEVQAASTQAKIYEAADIELLKATAKELSEADQTAVLQKAEGMRKDLGVATLDTQQAAGLLHGFLQERNLDPLALNAMAATPTGLEMATASGVQQQAQEAGLTTINEADIERLTQRAEALTTQLMAQGASDTEIRQSIAQLPGYTLDTATIVDAKVAQQLDADKFNMLSNRNAPEAAAVAAPAITAEAILTLAAADISTANVNDPVEQARIVAATTRAARESEALRRSQNSQPLAVGGGFAQSAPELPPAPAAIPAENRYGVSCARMECVDIPPAQFLAALGNLSAPATPNVALDRGQGFERT